MKWDARCVPAYCRVCLAERKVSPSRQAGFGVPERCRSGLTGGTGNAVSSKGTVGSNPTLSAYQMCRVLVTGDGVP